MSDIQHPSITQAERTGHPSAQPEHWGVDYFGNEILEGDSVVIDPENGEVVLEKHLEDYLIEVKGFQFKLAD